MAELPLLAFTILTGLSAGGYVAATAFGVLEKRRLRTFPFDVLCLALLGLGLLGTLLHLGHPERFLNALANPSAMIAQEAYWSIPFGTLVLVDAILVKARDYRGRALPLAASVLACGLMPSRPSPTSRATACPAGPKSPRFSNS